MRRARGLLALSVVSSASAAWAAPQSDPSSQTQAPPAQPSSVPQPANSPRGTSGALLTPAKQDDTPPAPTPPQITLPVLKRNAAAEYPLQAVKDGVREAITVTVLVTIGADGAIRNAEVPQPQGHGFDEAAIAAARQLEFEPARRNGTPIAAKVSHVFTFPPQTARLTGRVLSQGADKPLSGATVRATSPDGTTQMSVAGADGVYSFEGLVPGRYHLVVTSAGRATQESDEQLDPGQETTILVRLGSESKAEAAATGSKDEDGPEEVNVRGVRPPREVTRRTLEQRELSRIPGTNGDALRSLQNLPGVARPPGLAGLLIVRGSAPQDTEVYVNGTQIPLVYHFGGLSSVVPTEMLEKIDFYPGNYSAQYGRAMGGIVDVAIRDPKKDGIHALGQIDLIDARVMAEGPIGKTGWNFAVAGRRSWVDAWLKPVLEQTGAGVTTAPVYYDYQAMLQRDFNSHSSFRVLFFGADDQIDILIRNPSASDPSLGGGLSAHTGFWRGQARYENRFGKDTDLSVTAAAGRNIVDFQIGSNTAQVSTWPITGRAELTHRPVRGLTVNTGLDILYVPYDVFVRFPPPSRPGEPPSGPLLSRPSVESRDSAALYRPGAYVDFEIVPAPGVRLVPGLRADYAKETKEWDIGPRFNARQDLTRGFPRTTVKEGVGLYFQPPQPQETNPVFGQAGLRSNRALHVGGGVEQEVTRNLEISLEGFYKNLDHLVIAGHGNSGEGRAYGMETLIRYKPDSRFFGWIAYTLSRSERRDTPLDPIRLTQFDQTHILTLLGSYRLGHGWEIGGRFRLVSGNMYTPNTYGFYDENSGVYLASQQYPPFGSRLPLFHQLDIRVDKTWKMAGGSIGVYFDVLNVYNHQSVEGVSSNYNYSQSTFASGLPILPSIGIRGEL